MRTTTPSQTTAIARALGRLGHFQVNTLITLLEHVRDSNVRSPDESNARNLLQAVEAGLLVGELGEDDES